MVIHKHKDIDMAILDNTKNMKELLSAYIGALYSNTDEAIHEVTSYDVNVDGSCYVEYTYTTDYGFSDNSSITLQMWDVMAFVYDKLTDI